jgi:hypothetical protein
MGVNYETPHCATSSILLLLHAYLVQIFSSEIYSQTPSVHALPLMRVQVSHPYKTTGRILVLYILNFTFLDSRQADKIL